MRVGYDRRRADKAVCFRLTSRRSQGRRTHVTGKTHIAIGVASALAVAPLAGAPLGVPTDVVPQAIALVLGGMVGGMLPDTDTPSSMGARGTRRVWAALAVMTAALLMVDHVRGSDLALTLASGFSYEQLAGLAIVVATCAVGRASGHRGFSHSLVALALVGYGAWMLCRPIAVAVAVGYASHLALDLTNKRGAKLLWPWGRPLCLGLFESGRLADWTLFVLGVAAAALMVATRLQLIGPMSTLPSVGMTAAVTAILR